MDWITKPCNRAQKPGEKPLVKTSNAWLPWIVHPECVGVN